MNKWLNLEEDQEVAYWLILATRHTTHASRDVVTLKGEMHDDLSGVIILGNGEVV